MSITLVDGTPVVLRPMVPADEEALLRFFARLPEAERAYAFQGFVQPRVSPAPIGGIDDDRSLPLLAMAGDHIMGAATLQLETPVAEGNEAVVWLLVDPSFRRQGVGPALLREVLDFAFDAEIARLVLEAPAPGEPDVATAARHLGLLEAREKGARNRDLSRDLEPLELVPGAWCACGLHLTGADDHGHPQRAVATGQCPRPRFGALITSEPALPSLA
jgi:ribosomal protein S18 acetylase RimI-like enzyme